MLFFVCYVGCEYAMCNFTPNELCYVKLCYVKLCYVKLCYVKLCYVMIVIILSSVKSNLYCVLHRDVKSGVVYVLYKIKKLP